VAVTDEGPGLSTEDRGTPFSASVTSLERKTHRGEKSTGWGWRLRRKIVEAHGGSDRRGAKPPLAGHVLLFGLPDDEGGTNLPSPDPPRSSVAMPAKPFSGRRTVAGMKPW